MLDLLERFYGIDCAAFPLRSQLVTRTLEGTNNLPKRLYYIAGGVRDYLLKVGGRCGGVGRWCEV